VRARLIGARHLGLTDLPLSARGPLAARIYGGGDPKGLVEATNAFVVGFFDVRLKQTAPAQDSFPSAIFEQRPAELAPHRNIGVREWWTRRQ
jgi:hypothetical protein